MGTISVKMVYEGVGGWTSGWSLPEKNFVEVPSPPPQDLYTSQIIVQHEQFFLDCFTTEYPYNICADVLLIKIVFVLCSKTLHDTKYETNWLCYGTQSNASLRLVTGHK